MIAPDKWHDDCMTLHRNVHARAQIIADTAHCKGCRRAGSAQLLWMCDSGATHRRFGGSIFGTNAL